jgi:hypothetical protein
MNSERQKDKEDKSTGNETDCGKWGGEGEGEFLTVEYS